MKSNRSLLALILSLPLAISSCTNTAPPPAQLAPQPAVAAWTPSACPADQANLLIMGDWGADTDRQRQVAATLGSYSAGHGSAFNAFLTVGDNLPAPLHSASDMNWQKLFEDMYDARKLSFPFYATLGNHDYDNDKYLFEQEYVARHPDSRFKLPANWYRLDFPKDKPVVTVLMLNSNRDKLGDKRWKEQLQWMRQELAKPRPGQWLIVCAHHPLFNNGNHRDDTRLQKDWGELFKTCAVDFYFAGHDHTLQHLRIKDQPTQFIVVGGGGQKRMPIYRVDRGPFGRSLYGFAHVKCTADSVTVSLIDGLTGKTVHELVENPQRQLTIVQTTPNDKPLPAAQQAGAAKVNTPAHRVIKADGDDYKRMASVLSFTTAQRAAFDKAVRTSDQPEETKRRQVLAALPIKQLQRWAGYVLYAAIIDEFDAVALSDEQKQQAFAVCVALAGPNVDSETARQDPTLEPPDKLQEDAVGVIHDHVLTTVQRKDLAASAAASSAN